MNKFKAPDWCRLKYKSIKDAILGAADLAGAKIFQSSSFTFRIDDYEELMAFLKTPGHNKEFMQDEIMKIVYACKEKK